MEANCFAVIGGRTGGSMEVQAKVYTFDEVSKHNQTKDCWVIIDGKVYDVTAFLEEHPGGPEVLLAATGKDATMDFKDVGHSNSARKIMKGYEIGEIDVSTIPTKKVYVRPNDPVYESDKTHQYVTKLLLLLVPVMALGFSFIVRLLIMKAE